MQAPFLACTNGFLNKPAKGVKSVGIRRKFGTEFYDDRKKGLKDGGS